MKQSKYDILTPHGFKPFYGVSRKLSKGLVTIMTETGKKIECTLDHQIFSKFGFMSADCFEVDDIIKTKDGFERIMFMHINKYASKHVYDPIHVSGGHQYYSGDIVSHNCAFLGSSGTLIEGWKLKELVPKRPLQKRDGISLYKKSIEGHSYCIVADVSRGKGLDYSAFSVFDITKMPYEQVCSFRRNDITPYDYAGTLSRFVKIYNEAYVLIEINDIGEQVSEVLHFDLECETVLFTEHAGRSGKRISGGFGKNVDKGIRTTKTVKAVGCNTVKMLVEQDQLIINDETTIEEFSTFSRHGQSYEAESGCHDDTVMVCVLFGWLAGQQFFREMTDINTLNKLKQKSEEQMEEDLLPFGFSDFGGPTEDERLVIDFVEDHWLHDF